MLRGVCQGFCRDPIAFARFKFLPCLKQLVQGPRKPLERLRSFDSQKLLNAVTPDLNRASVRSLDHIGVNSFALQPAMSAPGRCRSKFERHLLSRNVKSSSDTVDMMENPDQPPALQANADHLVGQ